MKIVCIGGGPAGLFFASSSRGRPRARGHGRRAQPSRRDVRFRRRVLGRHLTPRGGRPRDPRGDSRPFAHWDDIEIHYRGEVLTSTGHGFFGSRGGLLDILQRRCRQVGVMLGSSTRSTTRALRRRRPGFAADGVNSAVRERYARSSARSRLRPNRFVWLGTTRPFPAFTFYFKSDRTGCCGPRVPVRAEPRPSSSRRREDTWRPPASTGRDRGETIAFSSLFAEELQGHPGLRTARSGAASRPSRPRWRHGNVVLAGDAAHTAHFSVGSGTKLAMEDAIALAEALREDVPAALAAYEARRPWSRASSAPRRRASSGSRHRALHGLDRSSSPSRCSPAAFVSPTTTSRCATRFVAKVDRGLPRARHTSAGADGGAAATADVHAVPPARAGAAEPRGGLADVPVLGRRWHARRLAPGALGLRAIGGAGWSSPR